MSKTPSLTSKELIKLLEQRGFVFDRSKGSHQIYFNQEKKLRIVVPMHNKDLPTGTLHAILKQADIDKNDL
ncbi:MAG: type II toxin-antitoxin system HicA family toxin [Parafilimonas sp.]